MMKGIQSNLRLLAFTALLSIGLVSLPRAASSIPLQFETNLTQSLPPEYGDATSINQHHFLRNTPENEASQAYFRPTTALPGSTNSAPPLWSDDSDTIKIIGRYSDSLYNLDLDVLDAELQTNTMRLHNDTDRNPLRPDLFLMDLSQPTQKKDEVELIMKDVARTLAAQNPSTPPRETEGVISAIVSLLMVAVVILVAIARR